VLVYDDRSEDGTARVVLEAARRDSRVRLLPGRELPSGWCGKTFACARLAAAASADWLLFLDADARLAPAAVPRLLADAEERGVTLLSAWPRLVMHTFWERALMPLLNVLTFSAFPAPLSLHRKDPSLGLAHGACILVSRRAYESVGGHAAVRGELFEDSRLAQLWRARGHRGLCLDGQDIVRVRMYRTLREIWGGFRKNFYPAFRREGTFWGFLLLHASVFLLPMVLVIVRPGGIAFAALGGLVVIRLVLAWRFGHPRWGLLLHPVAEAVLLGIALASWWRCRFGPGVEWKGRRYAGPAVRGAR
jgi:glycosyltransferase involved in cell wall biosynthesis